MLARLQRWMLVAQLAAAGAWLLFFLAQGLPLVAWAGCAAVLLGYAAVLALELVLQHHISRHGADDSAAAMPRPGWGELLQAWLGESRVAPRVFCWRQPFRANALPDRLGPPALVRGHRGVVFVHGFFCNRGFWNPWLRRLQGSCHAFVAVSLEPVFASIDHYADQIDQAVRQVTDATGLPPLLVCHSMGGLAARSWLGQQRAADRIFQVVTIGTPHHGTWLARFGHGESSRQMQLLSDWQKHLASQAAASSHARFTCWYSNTDNIVFPPSNATLPGASNRLVRAVGHVQLAFAPQVVDATLALLQPGPEQAAH